MKRKFRSIFIEILASTYGRIMVLLQPEKARQLTEKGMTIVLNGKLSLTERLMRRAILKNIEKKKDYDALAEFHHNYWSNQGDSFFSEIEDRFEKSFLPDCAFIFDRLKEELQKEAEAYNTLVEIGTGNGKVLEYLNSEFPEIEKFIGIDLSQKQIENNKKQYQQNTKLEFAASDGFEWIKEHGCGNTVFVTNGGVLEYFTEERLLAFLKAINKLGKIYFVAIEPNDIEHNFETNPNSQTYGSEHSFSHNYPELFKNAGFNLWHFSQQSWPGCAGINKTIIGAVS